MTLEELKNQEKLCKTINSQRQSWENQDFTINFDDISLSEFASKMIGVLLKKSFFKTLFNDVNIQASIRYKRKLHSFSYAMVFRPDLFCITLKHNGNKQEINYEKQIQNDVTNYVLQPYASNNLESIINPKHLKGKISSTFMKNDFVDNYELGWRFVDYMYLDFRDKMNGIGISNQNIFELFSRSSGFFVNANGTSNAPTIISFNPTCAYSFYEDLIKSPILFKSVLDHQTAYIEPINKFTVIKFIEKYKKDIAENYFEPEQFNKIYLDYYCANNKALTSLRNSGFFR